MLTLNVSTDIDRALRQLRSITEAQQFRFAAARALTRTAVDIQAEVRKNMPGRFTIRRDWVVRNIRVERATKADLRATIFSGDKFMSLQEFGGAKGPLRNYLAIPTSLVRRTPKDIIRKADRPAQLGDRAGIVEVNGRKYLALKRERKVRSGSRLRLLYLLIPRAQIRKRLGLAEDGMRVARARFSDHLRNSLEEALAQAR